MIVVIDNQQLKHKMILPQLMTNHCFLKTKICIFRQEKTIIMDKILFISLMQLQNGPVVNMSHIPQKVVRNPQNLNV